MPLTYPFARPPGPGESLEILPGVHWVRLPLPLRLDHVNVWVFEDEDRLTLIDTGIDDETTRGFWEQLLRPHKPAPDGGPSAVPADRPLGRLFVTHHHPDHCGLAAWLTKRHGGDLLTSRLAHEAGLVLQHRDKGTDMRSTAARLARHGLSAEAQASLVAGESSFDTLKPGLPHDFIPLAEGDEVVIGGRSWRVIFGQGHAPDHVCLYSAEAPGAGGLDGPRPTGRAGGRGILISGDMVLPHISTHVGSPATWLPGNPVALFQESVRRLADLPADTLVLPSHGEPFVGLRERVAELEAHHAARCRTIADALDEPHSAGELLEVVFQRELDPLQVMLAMNEAVAHLEYMTDSGELDTLDGDDGIIRYVRRRGR